MHRSLSTVLDLKKLKLPPVPKVDAIEWQPIVDHVGDDAYEITVIIPDNTSGSDRARELTRQIETTIRQALRDAGIEEFAYMRTLTRADLREAEENAEDEAAEYQRRQEQQQ